jgi:O-antigen/teichoic acid export membrane protein
VIQENVSRHVVRNFGVVLRGRGIAALLTLSATALMANALPATEFGLVILLHTYVLAVRGVLNFRTYEAVVRFGVPLHENANTGALKRLLGRTTRIDLAGGIGATLAGVAAAGAAGSLLHWDQQMTSLAGLYSLVMLSSVINTPNGMLRLYDRFDALSIFYIVGPTVRITGVIIAWLKTMTPTRRPGNPDVSSGISSRWSTGKPTSTCCPSISQFCSRATCWDPPLRACSGWRVIFPAS